MPSGEWLDERFWRMQYADKNETEIVVIVLIFISDYVVDEKHLYLGSVPGFGDVWGLYVFK